MATKKKTSETTPRTRKAVLAATDKPRKVSVEKSSDDSVASTSRVSKPSLKFRKSYVIIVLGLLALGLVLYAARGLFVVAMINGSPLTRIGVAAELEKMYGSQALDFLIVKSIVEQEARKKHVSVSSDEVNAEIKKNEEILKKNGQTLDQFLQFRGINKYQYTQGLKLQLLAKKIVGETKVTDKQVDEYLKQNEERFSTYTSDAEKKNAAKEELIAQEAGNKINEWLQNVRGQAKIQYIHKYE